MRFPNALPLAARLKNSQIPLLKRINTATTYFTLSTENARFGVRGGYFTLRVDSRTINRRYLPPPTTQSNSGTMDLRMRREVVLKFTKPSGFGQADVLKSSPDIALPVAVPLDRQQVCQQ